MFLISRRTLSALAVTVALLAVAAGTAQAKVFHVTGTKTTITPSAQVTKFLSARHITVTALGPATISSGSVTLPVSGGFVTKSTKAGLLRHAGGVQFSKGSRKLALRHIVLVANAHRGILTAVVVGHRMIVAHLIDITHTVSGKSGTLSGELTLSSAAAHRINRLFGKHLVSAGADLGSLTSSVTVG
jgi:hypothetical protein